MQAIYSLSVDLYLCLYFFVCVCVCQFVAMCDRNDRTEMNDCVYVFLLVITEE